MFRQIMQGLLTALSDLSDIIDWSLDIILSYFKTGQIGYKRSEN